MRDACVAGVEDRRLGEVPFAVVEAVPGATTPNEKELNDHVAQSLARHQVPVAIRVVGRLPRNHAMKVSLRDVAALYPGVS